MVNKCFASKGGFVDSMIGALDQFHTGPVSLRFWKAFTIMRRITKQESE